MDELQTYIEQKGGNVWSGEAETLMMYVDQDKVRVMSPRLPARYRCCLQDGRITLQELQDAKYLSPVTALYHMQQHVPHPEL